MIERSIYFESDRLIFRQFEPADATEIYPEVTARICQYLSFDPSPTPEAFQQIWGQWSGMMARGEELFLTMRERSSQEFAGVTGVKGLKEAPELGIWIREGLHGQGFGLEAISSLMNWAARELGLAELDYRVDSENLPSRKIAERLGGNLKDEWQETGAQGQICNMLRYRVRAPGMAAD